MVYKELLNFDQSIDNEGEKGGCAGRIILLVFWEEIKEECDNLPQQLSFILGRKSE